MEILDNFTQELLDELYHPSNSLAQPTSQQRVQAAELLASAQYNNLTAPIVELFSFLYSMRKKMQISPGSMGIPFVELQKLAVKHQDIDEHRVSVGGRLTQALPIAQNANDRVVQYLENHPEEAPSGIELWPEFEENIAHIKQVLKMDDEEWNSLHGQLRHRIDSAEQLGKVLGLSREQTASINEVTKKYRMRLTPYFASLIRKDTLNDPIYLQAVPAPAMIENSGEEIPPVAADHSPARLVDQFYPRVVTIKATNMCGMYCTHCLRISHIGKKDHSYAKDAYKEALAYIRSHHQIRDVLITGGDALMLPDSLLEWLLAELDAIDHVKTKRLGTRIPVTAPMRVTKQLLEVISRSNDKKPVRVVTQINTPQEITPVSKNSFRQLSKASFTVLNQAVLLKDINDSQVKLWKLCETVHEAYVRPYYLFNCSFRNPQFKHFRVPLEIGRDLVESMYGNICGDAIPRYIATAGGKIPLHRSNVIGHENGEYLLQKPWNGEQVTYPDADSELYNLNN